ncbi:MAG: ATP-binding cassette domain-containing protein [Rhodobacteraceae bacterium]|nr:ATP-binding cassette domain-containing protein [Paracoccaceae bacterium]
MTAPLPTLLGRLRGLAPPLILFSFVTNLTVLVSPLFMMQVLDRVVPTGNLNTLALLFFMALCALTMNAAVEYFRDQALAESARWMEQGAAAHLLQRPVAQTLDHLRHVAVLRDFLSGRGALVVLDLPWVGIFAVALYLINPAFLLLAFVATLSFGLIALVRAYLAGAAQAQAAAHGKAGMDSLKQVDRAGVARGLMSLGRNLADRYLRSLSAQSAAATRAGRIETALDCSSRFLRSGLQLGALAIGAMLVARGQLSAGGMIGASLLMGKCLSTADGTIAAWPTLRKARAAYLALAADAGAAAEPRTEIADLTGALRAVNLVYPRGAGAPPRIDRCTFALEAGTCLAILGESGSGKTTLLHALCGIDPAPIGNSFMDQTDVRTLDTATRDRQIGYLPQQADLAFGTIAEIISRFDPNPDDAEILAAARRVGVHGMISALPLAYETDMAKFPHLLSAGQKQRIALARAIYGNPRYLFMDEPNALLDNQGERQLGDAILRLKHQGTTIVMVVHRTGIVSLADKVAVMQDGRIIEFGDRREIMGRMANSHRRIRVPIHPASVQDLMDWVARQFVRDGDEAFRQRASVITRELYNFACDNGPKDPERRLSFEFTFIDDATCSITLAEPFRLKLERKISKIREIATQPNPILEGLPVDEASLATVIRLSDHFEHRASEKQSAYVARLVQTEPPAASA